MTGEPSQATPTSQYILLKHFKTFEMIEAVVRAGSIRKAAEDMNITASALNRRIQGFEAEFGYELF